MEINVVGIIGIAVFYLLILVLGIWAGCKKSKHQENGEQHDESNEVMLAGRSIGLFVGCFTMTATWVGGGYINGTAEAVYKYGLTWAQSSWGYSLSLCFGGFLFAKIMRRRGYVTMLDPFQDRYGIRVGGLMYIPAFLGELIWSAATLNSLSATISIVMNISRELSVAASACIAVFYTFLGGLWSVAYTDVAQLICMFIGMWLTIPFALTHKAVTPISQTKQTWVGDQSWEWGSFGNWMDNALLLIFGGIPWQVYFQRVLSSKTHKRAQYLSFAASVGCLIMAVPSILIGAIGKSTDWEQTGFNSVAERDSNGSMIIKPSMIMPMVLQYLTPTWASFVGLGAVSAAVMSSVDSSVLSASSMYAHNIYKTIFRQRASDKEVIWVIRASIIVVGALATAIGLTVESIYGLSYLCSDIIYVVLFPELLCVLYFGYSNTYGALFGYIMGFLLRLLGGEPLINMPAVIKYPLYKETKNGSFIQNFPFRTLNMVITLFCIVFGSLLAQVVFKYCLSLKFDIAGDFQNGIPNIELRKMVNLKGVDIKPEYKTVLLDNAATANGKESHEMEEHMKAN
ncbi:high-affinity choline transporter 1-like isoform X2 [Rhopilema esculentum]|eukprot:gene7173-12839_t